MPPVSQVTSDLKNFLRSTTSVADWDYQGAAPDQDSPLVGSVWPIEVKLPQFGGVGVVECLCVVGIWADGEQSLLAQISSFVTGLQEAFVSGACTSSGVLSVGDLTVGVPSTSASSSIGTFGGVWVAVSFNITVGK